jgi:hypothetical protein
MEEFEEEFGDEQLWRCRIDDGETIEGKIVKVYEAFY